MLFNSYEYIFFFLPLTVVGFFWLSRRVGSQAARLWLCGASICFYGWWNPVYVLLIAVLLLANFLLGFVVAPPEMRGMVADPGRRRAAFIAALAFNLLVLAYFKYADFLIGSANTALGTHLPLLAVVLPLGISFFTFQKIGYLVDVYQGKALERDLGKFSLFVLFFPQLIAGPIVHHGEILPQFAEARVYRLRLANLCIGIAIFSIGLFKKVVLADSIAPFAGDAFLAVERGERLDLFAAWGGALAYTMQLYFDFSGYTDMAIGAARLFGIRLPLNFHSPYKATSITEFWRRWHMTLSRFLRDYLYIPLGGNRQGPARRYLNLIVTMGLGGLWHGASWTFLMWGVLHGVYLLVNHAWRAAAVAARVPPALRRAGRVLSWALTFTCVVVGWVFFRATSFESALLMLKGMAGLHGAILPEAIASAGPLRGIVEPLGIGTALGGGGRFVTLWASLAALTFIALACPNTQEIMRRFRPALDVYAWDRGTARRWWAFRLAPSWAAMIAVVSLVGVLALTRASEFLYFQF